MAPSSLETEAKERLSVTVGETEHLWLTQDHTATQWCLRQMPFCCMLLRVEEPRQEQQELLLPQEWSKLRQGWPTLLFVGVVDCLVGQDGPHTCFAVPV